MATCGSTTHPKPLPLFIFLVITIAANPLIKIISAAHPDPAGSMFDLIHVDRLPARQHLSQSERIVQMLDRDMARVRGIQKLQQQNVGPQTFAGQTPIISGSSFGVGEYFVELMIGTPVKKFLVIADTGSDLTWVDCNNNKSRPKPAPGGGVFDAVHSTSFKTIVCSSTTCKNDLSSLFSLSLCPHPNDACLYDYSYGESAAAQGVFGHETVTFDLTNGKKRALVHTVFGCTSSRQGLEPLLGTVANGIMSLSNSPFSLQNQASKLFGQTFSYCLVDLLSDNTTFSKLFFGSPPQGMPKITGSMQSTQLVKADSFYGVNIASIFIGGRNLTTIPASAWKFTKNRDGGAIVDSGTTLTYLLDPVYGPVMEALTKSLSRFGKRKGPFEHCYNIRGSDDRKAPEIEIRFVDGARLVVPGRSYLTDVANGVKCVAFLRVESGYNVIGNMLQQNHLWVFDTKMARLSFGSSTCTSF